VADSLDQLHAELLELLQDARLWRTTRDRWETVAGLLEAAADHLSDADALQPILAQLELNGPSRIVRLGSVPQEPPPPVVRERLNKLVHKLSGTVEEPE